MARPNPPKPVKGNGRSKNLPKPVLPKSSNGRSKTLPKPRPYR